MPKYVMSDGRNFTDYNASCVLNQAMQKKYNTTNSHDYRFFLQQNADKVMLDMADCKPDPDCLTCPVCKHTF